MARTKAQRRAEKREGSAFVHGIRKRGKAGRQFGPSHKERQQAAPELRYRKSLFADGQKGLAWRAEAGFPLGIYFLRKELTQVHFDTGLRYLRLSGLVSRVFGLPRPFPATARLDPVIIKSVGREWEPSPAEMRQAGVFLEIDLELKKAMARQHRALELCCLGEVMGKRAERCGNETLPEYDPKDVKEILEEFERKSLP